ncbi:MAG: ferrochelatase [Chitinophagaceae bacterium]
MGQAVKRGVILMNLGSPDSTQVKDVSRYLKQFLMDERVIDYPYLLRALLVKGIIVPFRAPKSAEAYKTVWTKDGSPLVVLTKQLQAALQNEVTENVAIGMRYGNPSPEAAFDELLSKEPGLEEVILVPLYPHYAMASYETAVEYAKEIYKKNNYSFKITTIRPFFDEPHYLAAMVENMRPYLQQDYDHILFSYHGIPERHIRKSDTTGHHCLQVADCCNVASPAHAYCYRHQVFTTTNKIVEQLGIPAGKFSLSFQSRLGKGWLQPFTDIRFEEMPKEGIKKLLVISPAFVSDCLETLEELEERGKETFVKAGGESFTMIPCLNIHPLWVNAIAGWIKAYAAGDKKMVTS